MVFMGDVHAVISVKKYGLIIFAFYCSDFNTWGWLIAHIFCGIVDQVLQDFCQTLTISINGWQVWLSPDRHNLHDRTTFLKPPWDGTKEDRPTCASYRSGLDSRLVKLGACSLQRCTHGCLVGAKRCPEPVGGRRISLFSH